MGYDSLRMQVALSSVRKADPQPRAMSRAAPTQRPAVLRWGHIVRAEQMRPQGEGTLEEELELGSGRVVAHLKLL